MQRPATPLQIPYSQTTPPSYDASAPSTVGTYTKHLQRFN